MTAIAEQLLETFRRLPRSEQLEVAHTIEIELASEATPQVSGEDLTEAQKRLDEYRQNPLSAVPHQEARAHLRSLL